MLNEIIIIIIECSCIIYCIEMLSLHWQNINLFDKDIDFLAKYLNPQILDYFNLVQDG